MTEVRTGKRRRWLARLRRTSSERSLRELRDVAQRILVVDVGPFWQGTVDRRHGGYRLNHDACGRWLGPADKFLVTQTRTLWYFARLARAGLASGEEADVGYRFLRDRLWDHEHGGFLWSVDHEGRRATTPAKHLYGQAFALFALCEHARATGGAEARELCGVVFDHIERHGHDAEHLGYREWFADDWSPPPADHLGHLRAPPGHKLLNTHLHLLEAIMSFVELDGGELPRRRLAELIEVCGRRAVDPEHGACRDQFHGDWTPLRGAQRDRASYGHDLENVSLLLCGARTLGCLDGELVGRCRRIADHALAHGFDHEHGGFFASGPLGAPADRREKIYWMQAEALFGLLCLWEATGEPVYLDALRRTLAWVDRVQVDRAGGDWHAVIAPDGTTSGNKADAWKDPYHQARALLALCG